ncbi:MAG: hypothetical protein NZM04_02645 [Methylacidiphilales bacterium]|nr:hypothetical protein [Candidatus Methylacidiphilales bacterium]
MSLAGARLPAVAAADLVQHTPTQLAGGLSEAVSRLSVACDARWPTKSRLNRAQPSTKRELGCCGWGLSTGLDNAQDWLNLAEY